MRKKLSKKLTTFLSTALNTPKQDSIKGGNEGDNGVLTEDVMNN